MNDTERTVIETYTYPLLEGTPKILNYSDDIRNFNIKEQVVAIANKWRGIPLKGLAQEELIQNFTEIGITDKKRCSITTFRGFCSVLIEAGIELKEKQATKKDLEQWPQYLAKPREKFKIIV